MKTNIFYVVFILKQIFMYKVDPLLIYVQIALLQEVKTIQMTRFNKASILNLQNTNFIGDKSS